MELASLRQIAFHDLQVYDWIQKHRSCALDRVASFVKYWTLRDCRLNIFSEWLGIGVGGTFAVIVIGGALLANG